MVTRAVAAAVALALVVLLGGCSAITGFGGYSGASADGGGVDAAAREDAGRSDGAVDGAVDGGFTDGGSVCEPACGTGETCNDGTCFCGANPGCAAGRSCCGGECIDTATSLTDCGGCDVTCTAGANATPVCTSGGCTVACGTGYEDCNATPSDGCETDITATADCGACGVPCGMGDVCRAGACETSCAAGETACTGTCASLMTSVMHCGGCGVLCPDPANASPTCAMGRCGFVCDGEFQDCNGVPDDGCEIVPLLSYLDGDGDGYGAGAGTRRCGPPSGFATTAGDCNDSEADINPGATELCNGIDDDCDTMVDDGFGVGSSCFCVSGAAPGTTICGGSTMTRCAYPGELCNGLDDDCDGLSDDGFGCIRGSTTTCTISAPVGGAVCAGTRTCSSACTLGSCVGPPEMCGDNDDDDCNGFMDDTALSTGPRTAIATSSADIHAAWKPDGTGGAVVYFQSSPPGVYARFFDAGGLPLGTPTALATGAGVTDPVAVGWDGASYVAFWMTGGSVQYGAFSASGLMGPSLSHAGSRVVAATLPTGGIGVLIRNGYLLEGAILGGTIARPFFTLMSVSGGPQWDDIAITAVSGAELVGVGVQYVGGMPGGQLRYRPFTNSTLGTTRTAVNDAATIPARPSAAADPVSRQLAIGYELSSSSRLAIRAIDSGSATQDYVLPSGANQVTMSFIPNPSGAAGTFLVSHSVHSRRLRGSDGVFYSETINAFQTRREAIATPGGRYLALSFDGRTGEPSFMSQGLGCP